MFHPELVSFLKLLERSTSDGDGWRIYTKATQRLVAMNDMKFPGLFEIDVIKSRVRPTPECDILIKWMNFIPRKPGETSVKS